MKFIDDYHTAKTWQKKLIEGVGRRGGGEGEKKFSGIKSNSNVCTKGKQRKRTQKKNKQNKQNEFKKKKISIKVLLFALSFIAKG